MNPHGAHGRRGPHPSFNLPDVTLDESTPQPYRVFHAMRGVMRAQKQLLMARLGEKDAHFAQALTLWILSENEGISPSELADRLNVKRPTVTVMLKKMERAGLVDRWLDEQDQRYIRVRLTDAGRALHAELKETHAAVVEATVIGMTEDDQRELERLLRQVEENLNTALKQQAGDMIDSPQNRSETAEERRS